MGTVWTGDEQVIWWIWDEIGIFFLFQSYTIMKGEIKMYDKPKLLKGMLNALLLEGFAVIVIYGLFKIIMMLLNLIW